MSQKYTRLTIILVMGSILLAACGGGGSNSSQPTSMSTSAPVTQPTAPASAPTTASTGSASDLATTGKTVYGANCASCHGESGQGNGSFPALAGNAKVTGDPAQMIQFVLKGKGGSHQFGDKLSDQEIAAVLTFVRANWGNEASPVTEEQVKAER